MGFRFETLKVDLRDFLEGERGEGGVPTGGPGPGYRASVANLTQQTQEAGRKAVMSDECSTSIRRFQFINTFLSYLSHDPFGLEVMDTNSFATQLKTE
jgi:hypothetical protein